MITCSGWHTATAQQVIVNSSGDRIIMYPDGSWRAVASQDSLLLRQYLQKTGSPETDNMVNASGKARNKGEEQEYLLRQCQNLKQRILRQEKIVQDDFRTATNNQFTATEQYRKAEANKKLLTQDFLDKMESVYSKSIEALRKAKLSQKAIRQLVEEANDLAEKPASITQRKIDRLDSKFILYLNTFGSVLPTSPEAERQVAASSAETKLPEETTVAGKPSPGDGKADFSNENAVDNPAPAMLPNPEVKPYVREPYVCQPALDTIDRETGRSRIELPASIVFTHTDADLRPFLKDKELITCRGHVWRTGPYVYLNLEFQISSSHSQNNFGVLQEGSLVRVKLLNGDFISLYNLKSDRGHIDPYTGNTVFSGQYALGKEEIKKLKSGELDKIRVLWGTGYEDYDVANMDFFANQLGCLLSRS